MVLPAGHSLAGNVSASTSTRYIWGIDYDDDDYDDDDDDGVDDGDDDADDDDSDADDDADDDGDVMMMVCQVLLSVWR